MAIFDQRGQHVTYQYNAAGDINFGAVQDRVDVIRELEKLQTELPKAVQGGALDEERGTDVAYQLTKAVQQAKKSEPEKQTVLGHLSSAKSLLEGVSTAGGLLHALSNAVQVVQQFFS